MQMKNKPGGMDPSQFESGAANRSRRLNMHMLYFVLQASFNLSFYYTNFTDFLRILSFKLPTGGFWCSTSCLS